MNNIERQLEFFEEYGIENEYIIEDDKLVVDGGLCLPYLTSCHKDFLKDTVINGSLYLLSLTSCHKDFLKGSVIDGSLDLRSLKECHKDFLKGSVINGWLDLQSLTSCHKDFLKDTVINGNLWLNSLNFEDQSLLRSNVKELVEGYNQEKGYCYFDNTLSKVLNVSNKLGYTIYETLFEYVAQKGDFTAHGKTIKKSIQDLEFKILSDKIKNEPIYEDTLVTVQKYRMITGACEFGCKNFMEKNNIKFTHNDGVLKEITPITVKELLPILEKNNAYGLEKFKSLIKTSLK